MSDDSKAERLLDEVEEAESWSGPGPDWMRQQAWVIVLLAVFFVGFNIEWRLLHPTMRMIYAATGLAVGVANTSNQASCAASGPNGVVAGG